MAQKVQVLLVDDLDGGDADETVQFALDGVSYAIDLSAGNAQKLRNSFASYVAEARRVGGRTNSRRRTGRASRSSRADANVGAVREWARANGHQVADRGRVSANVMQAYRAAH